MIKAELIEAVKVYLNRPNMPAAEVAILLATAHGEIDRVLRGHPRSRVTRPYTIPIGHDNIPLPADHAQLVRVYGQDSTPWERVELLSKLTGNNWVDGGNCLWVGVSAVERPIYLDYYAHLEPMAEDGSTNWVSVHFPDLYLYGALVESAVFLKADERMSLWQQQFRRRLEEVSIDGWNANIGAASRVRP
jgi:hypothetical protein